MFMQLKLSPDVQRHNKPYSRGSTTSGRLERILMSRTFRIRDNFATSKKRRAMRNLMRNISKSIQFRNVRSVFGSMKLVFFVL